ncbi:MAG: hypothetical protein LBE01_00515, partial [Deltaproteobacteria bacterium]|nr:hypothetical protein [Deltaproteobacteria bacterium]
MKEPGGRVRIGLIWPGDYATGMASLGFLAVYSLLNANPRVFAERVFQPPPGQPSRSLETKSPLLDFDALAASLPLENDYWVALDILARGRVDPERARRAGEPLVIAGGVGIWANPWPMTPFVDVILAGEAERQWPTLLGFYLDPFFRAAPKAEKLKLIGDRVLGALVPSRWPEEALKGEAPWPAPVKPALLGWPP